MSPENAYKWQHFHLRSVVKQWTTMEANEYLERPFPKAAYGVSNFQPVLCFDVQNGVLLAKIAQRVCSREDLYTLPLLSTAARGIDIAAREKRHDELVAQTTDGHSRSILHNAETLGAPEPSLFLRRVMHEQKVFGEQIDDPASSAMDCIRADEAPSRSHLQDLARYLLSLHQRTPWFLQEEAPRLVESLFAKTETERDLTDKEWLEVRGAVLERLRATVPILAQLQRAEMSVTFALEVLRPGLWQPQFVLGDNAGTAWAGLHDVDGTPVLHRDGQLFITYPIAPNCALRLRAQLNDTGRREFIFDGERHLTGQQVMKLNIEQALGAREVVILPRAHHSDLFPPTHSLPSLCSQAMRSHE